MNFLLYKNIINLINRKQQEKKFSLIQTEDYYQQLAQKIAKGFQTAKALKRHSKLQIKILLILLNSALFGLLQKD